MPEHLLIKLLHGLACGLAAKPIITHFLGSRWEQDVGGRDGYYEIPWPNVLLSLRTPYGSAVHVVLSPIQCIGDLDR